MSHNQISSCLIFFIKDKIFSVFGCLGKGRESFSARHPNLLKFMSLSSFDKQQQKKVASNDVDPSVKLNYNNLNVFIS